MCFSHHRGNEPKLSSFEVSLLFSHSTFLALFTTAADRLKLFFISLDSELRVLAAILSSLRLFFESHVKWNREETRIKIKKYFRNVENVCQEVNNSLHACAMLSKKLCKSKIKKCWRSAGEKKNIKESSWEKIESKSRESHETIPKCVPVSSGSSSYFGLRTKTISKIIGC